MRLSGQVRLLAVAAAVGTVAVSIPSLLPSGDSTEPLVSPASANPTQSAFGPYRSPHSAAFTPNGRLVVVSFSASDTLAMFDAANRIITAEIPVGREPHGVAVSPDGKYAYVAHYRGHSVGVVDLAAKRMVKEIPVGWYPEGVALEPVGRMLWVANSMQGTVSVIDTLGWRVTDEIPVAERPTRLAATPDGRAVLVTCDAGGETERTVCAIDTATRTVFRPLALGIAGNLRGIAVSRDGRFAVVAHQRPKTHKPVTQIDGGWVVTNAVTRILLSPSLFAVQDPWWRRTTGFGPPPVLPSGTCAAMSSPTQSAPTPGEWGRAGPPPPAIACALLDQPDRFFADPCDVHITPDGKTLLVTASGANAVLKVSTQLLDAKLDAQPNPKKPRLAVPATVGYTGQDLRTPDESKAGGPTLAAIGGSADKSQPPLPPTAADRTAKAVQDAPLVSASIPTGAGPKYAALSPDGKHLWCCCPLDDSITVVDVAAGKGTRVTVSNRPMSPARRGEQIFHDARGTHLGAFSCATCHPGGDSDGFNWNLNRETQVDAFLNTKSLLGTLAVGPFGWFGRSPDLKARFRETFHKTMHRESKLSEADEAALTAYLKSARPLPMPRHDEDDLGESAERGRELFRGKGKCMDCHVGPGLTSGEMRDVGTGATLRIPSLKGIWRTAPYLHRGQATNLRDIWTPANNPKGLHGAGGSLTAAEMDDLTAFLKTL